MKQMHIFFALALLLLTALSCGTADNPVTGTIQGEVESIDGVAIQVRLIKDEQLVVQTEAAGSYQLNEIETGDYTLHISAEGYQEMEFNVTVVADETVSLDKVTLELAPGQGLSIGSQAPNFELPDGNGTPHALSDYVGNNKKVVLVFYRGGW